MSQVIVTFRSLRAGSHVFDFLLLFLCVILHNVWSGKSLKLLCIFPFCILFRVPARMFVRRPAPINQLFNDESIAVHIFLLIFIRGNSHGFDRT